MEPPQYHLHKAYMPIGVSYVEDTVVAPVLNTIFV